MFLLLITVMLFAQYGCNKDCIKSSSCDLEPEAGPCFAAIPKYYFDKAEGKCKEFIWGGCYGVVPFNTLEECVECECNE